MRLADLRHSFGFRGSHLPHVRARLRYNHGSTSRQTICLRDPNDLENSEGCRSAGGHGNQHVRLRIAQIDGNDLPGSM
jgi:hypothetical protein